MKTRGVVRAPNSSAEANSCVSVAAKCAASVRRSRSRKIMLIIRFRVTAIHSGAYSDSEVKGRAVVQRKPTTSWYRGPPRGVSSSALHRESQGEGDDKKGILIP